MTDKRSESQFTVTEQQRGLHSLGADYHGFNAGAHPYAYTVSDLQKRAAEGHETPISGDALTSGVNARKKENKK